LEKAIILVEAIMTIRKVTTRPKAVAENAPREDRQHANPETSRPVQDAVCMLAALLIPGRGPPQADGVVVAEKGVITYVGPLDGRPAQYQHLPVVRVPVLMPGLWDCHTHFTGTPPNRLISMDSMSSTNAAEAGARAARSAYDTLMAGVTSCIDLGGYAIELQKVIAEGSILGPTMYGAGAAISMTAGHGDSFG
jgi:imidazolonepropionase-like amidohydrolase